MEGLVHERDHSFHEPVHQSCRLLGWSMLIVNSTLMSSLISLVWSVWPVRMEFLVMMSPLVK
jgi:hypothetical protein